MSLGSSNPMILVYLLISSFAIIYLLPLFSLKWIANRLVKKVKSRGVYSLFHTLYYFGVIFFSLFLGIIVSAVLDGWEKIRILNLVFWILMMFWPMVIGYYFALWYWMRTKWLDVMKVYLVVLFAVVIAIFLNVAVFAHIIYPNFQYSENTVIALRHETKSNDSSDVWWNFTRGGAVVIASPTLYYSILAGMWTQTSDGKSLLYQKKEVEICEEFDVGQSKKRCMASGGEFENGVCDCKDDYVYDVCSAYCRNEMGVPGGEVGESFAEDLNKMLK